LASTWSRTEESIPTGIVIGIDVGLNHFYTDSTGETIPNSRHLLESEKACFTVAKTSFSLFGNYSITAGDFRKSEREPASLGCSSLAIH